MIIIYSCGFCAICRMNMDKGKLITSLVDYETKHLMKNEYPCDCDIRYVRCQNQINIHISNLKIYKSQRPAVLA